MPQGDPRPPFGLTFRAVVTPLALVLAVAAQAHRLAADGMVVPPRDYQGSLAERSQEAIILFHAGDGQRPAQEDLILKVRVAGAADTFAWVVPFPEEPVTAPEDGKLFVELHRYVQLRLAAAAPKHAGGDKGESKAAEAPAPGPVEVLSRKDVGSYDVAVVRERRAGSLNDWLVENGYRRVEGADDLIDAYRTKGYVFACVRVRDAAHGNENVDLHPLRFSFKTGGRDGVYFPMRLTGLQGRPFDVNLYVLYGKWLNDRVNGFGYAHRGFSLVWRDFDSPKCDPNAGKGWSDPASDPYLSSFAGVLPTVTKLCQKLHPGDHYYLTNLSAENVSPADVRAWPDDLWLFPYYTDPAVVPEDARPGGPAAGAYPHAAELARARGRPPVRYPYRIIVLIIVVSAVSAWFARRALKRKGPADNGRVEKPPAVPE